MVKLRDYQIKAIDDIREAFMNGYRAPLLTAPTGSGKTAILAEICSRTLIKHTKTIILVHRQELVLQTSHILAKFNIEHSIIAPNKVIQNSIKVHIEEFKRSFFRDESNTYIATVQTLIHRMEDLPKFDLILIDEAHHGVAGTWMKIIQSYPNAKLLGVTATPERFDGKGLGKHCGGIFDKLIIGPRIKDLIEKGYLTKPRVYCPPSDIDFTDIKIVAGDFDKKEQSKRLNKPKIIGNVINHYKKYCHGFPAIAFCPTVEYAKYVADNFNSAGYRASSIDGNLDDYKRNQVIKDLGSGKLDILTSCEIISEGTDIPVVGAAILLRKTRSLAVYLQQVGRALRPYPGKSETIILDHVGNSYEHGLPDDDHNWTLDDRIQRNRINCNRSPSCKQCLNCYSIYSSSITTCPVCGTPALKTKKEIEEVEGELVEFKKRLDRSERGRARSIEELIKYGKLKGYKNPMAWAMYVYKGRKARKS